MNTLIDGFGRVHRDLRISLTDHCNLRCTYCMPAEGVPWLARNTLLSPTELMRIVEVAVAEGITEVRLTGGEPLLRPDVVDVVAAIHSIENAPEISITTNGIALPKLAQKLADAGLARVNISIDTLDRLRFKVLTRRDRLDDVLEGIDAAKAAGLTPVKVNSVLMRGINDDEAPALLRWAMAEGLELRFIEQMPLDAGHTWSREGMVTAAETLARLRTEHDLEAIPGRGAAPAERFLVDGGPHTVGIIASVTMPFCGACDRLRLTADGQLRSCLFSTTESDLRAPLRSGASDEEVAAILHRCLAGKLAGHGINEPGFLQPPRPMSAIGG
ncbi:MAG: GTP 3',8-cyclase MoaA [Arachnia sp.]